MFVHVLLIPKNFKSSKEAQKNWTLFSTIPLNNISLLDNYAQRGEMPDRYIEEQWFRQHEN